MRVFRLSLTIVVGALVALASACSGTSDGPIASVAPANEPAVSGNEALPAVEDAKETLRLARVEASAGQIVIDLVYARRPEQAAPRVMELRLKASPGLRYSASLAGPAAKAAAKDLTVQDLGDGVLRVLLFGTTSLATLDTGVLCQLTFERIGDQPATVELLPDMPIFAPENANDGVLLAGPLTVEGH